MPRSARPWPRGSGSVRCIRSIQQTVAGDVADTDLQFVVVQSPTNPWNTLLGGILEIRQRLPFLSSRAGSALASRSSRRPCTGSDLAVTHGGCSRPCCRVPSHFTQGPDLPPDKQGS